MSRQGWWPAACLRRLHFLLVMTLLLSEPPRFRMGEFPQVQGGIVLVASAALPEYDWIFPQNPQLGPRYPRMVTLFSVECGPYFDWQTAGLMHSYRCVELKTILEHQSSNIIDILGRSPKRPRLRSEDLRTFYCA